MPIKMVCECGITLFVPEDRVGKRAKCSACGKELAVASPSALRQTATAEYVYKMVQIPPSIKVGDTTSIGQTAASYLERVVNAQANDGWDFYRIDSIGVTVAPGCLAAFVGGRAINHVYYVVTIRQRSRRSSSYGIRGASRLQGISARPDALNQGP